MGELAFADVARAAAERDPGLGDILVRYMAQEDPEPGVAEVAPDDAKAPTVPEGAWTLDKLEGAVSSGLRGKTATERRIARRDAFDAAAASPFAPPRLALGRLLIDLYTSGDDAAREALIVAFRDGQLAWGAWQGAKSIYKLAEANNDAALFGVLGYRFDTMSTSDTRGEVGGGTFTYLKRRVWRYLRRLGQTVPELYPTFAVEVLRHYKAGYKGLSWVASHIWSHENMRGEKGPESFSVPNERALKGRAFPDTWKLSPAPLLRLLDVAENEDVCSFAVRVLKADHPLALRAVEPAWLARLGARPIGALHAFVVELLKDNPELHASRLAEVGLKDTVVGFLKSPDASARAYALDYVRAHVPDLPIELLMELLGSKDKQVVALGTTRIEAMLPTLDLGVLVRLLAFAATREAAGNQIKNRFAPADVTAEMFVQIAYSGDASISFLVDWFNAQKVSFQPAFWRAAAADPRRDRRLLRWIMGELGKWKATSIGIDWIKSAVEDPMLREFALGWLREGKVAGDDLDVDWVKSLLSRPSLKQTALAVLGNPKVVAPTRVGIDWLVGLTGSSDPDLRQFAESKLLPTIPTADFKQGGRAGVDLMWDLAVSPKEQVRVFASTWIRVHHPEIGPVHSDLKTLGIKPQLESRQFGLDRVRPLFEDERVEPRRLAVSIAKVEFLRWGDKDLVYQLAASKHREPRSFACDLLLSATIDPPAADALPLAWIDGAKLFALTESAHKATRETALTVIRALFDKVGTPERLAWLMESPERDVRLFAVRLFWDRYRPVPGRKAAEFPDVQALRQFLRTVMFGLPPGRVEQRGPVDTAKGAPLPVRPLPASVGKRRLVEAVRDLGAKDVGFASVMVPVLTEFVASEAKGEWQACVAALATMKAAHGPRLDLEGAR